MENINFLLFLLFIGGIIVYFGYCYLIEGYKGLFKGRMNLKVRKPLGDHYISGMYARIWGAIYLFFGLIVVGVFLFALHSILSSFHR